MTGYHNITRNVTGDNYLLSNLSLVTTFVSAVLISLILQGLLIQLLVPPGTQTLEVRHVQAVDGVGNVDVQRWHQLFAPLPR